MSGMFVEKIWQSDWKDHLASESGRCQISTYAHDDLACKVSQGISREGLLYLAKQLCCSVLGYLAFQGGSRAKEIVKDLW